LSNIDCLAIGPISTSFNLNYLAKIFLADNYAPSAHNGNMPGKTRKDCTLKRSINNEKAAVQNVRYVPGLDPFDLPPTPYPLPGSNLSTYPEVTSARLRLGCSTIAIPQNHSLSSSNAHKFLSMRNLRFNFNKTG
jgi:hypothetical protein